MRFYKVHFYSDTEGSQGFAWFTVHRKAAAAAAKFRETAKEYNPQPDIETVDIEPTKRRILALLECYATHPDNG